MNDEKVAKEYNIEGGSVLHLVRPLNCTDASHRGCSEPLLMGSYHEDGVSPESCCMWGPYATGRVFYAGSCSSRRCFTMTAANGAERHTIRTTE